MAKSKGVLRPPSKGVVESKGLPEANWDALEHAMERLPEWVETIRPHQVDAIGHIVDQYLSGNQVVFLDAPTGSGKTLIAEIVRLLLTPHSKTAYVCSGRELQRQFVGDYPHAKLLEGRSNYSTLDKPYPFITAADCTKTGSNPLVDSCHHCHNIEQCPYEIAKNAALMSPLAVLNTSYLLYEANFVGRFGNRRFVVADECDTLESNLMGFVEFQVSKRDVKDLELKPPKKGSHKPTITKWLTENLIPLLESEVRRHQPPDVDEVQWQRTMKHYSTLLGDAGFVAGELDSNWIRDNDAGPLVMKPVTVGRYGYRNLWKHGTLWLPMSATIISTEQMASDLGLTGQDEHWTTMDGDGHKTEIQPYPYSTVSVGMTFPKEHRPIFITAMGNMTRKGLEAGGMKDMMTGVRAILMAFPDDNILVHCHSYKIAGELYEEFNDLSLPHIAMTYRKARDREGVLANFKRRADKPGAVLFAPSMDRGIDLPGESCRVQIIAKTPFGYLGDPQISTRMNEPGGNEWYAVETARTVVQMTGRPVRSMDDWAYTFILDQGFFKFYKENRHLLPDWWVDAVESIPSRQFHERVKQIARVRPGVQATSNV